MVARPTQRRKGAAAPARKAAPAAKRTAPAKKSAPKAAPKPQRADVTSYATKDVTDYHKAFAKWIVTEVGFDPETASSKRMAFLKGVSIATAARPAFMESEFLEEWRDRTGTAKRGPKPTQEEAAPVAKTRRKPAPEPVVEEDEDFEDEAEDFEDDEDDADEFEDDEDSDDDEDFEDDEDSDEDDADEDFEEEEPEPPARRRKATAAAPAKRAPARGKAAPARKPAAKAAPVKGRRAKADDDEFLF